jgi:two-component system, sensor histidine kinase
VQWLSTQRFFGNKTEVRKELFRLGFNNLKIHLLAHVCLVALIAFASLGVVQESVLTLWICWMVFVACALISGIYWFGRVFTNKLALIETLDKWQLYHFAMVCLIGIGWGSGGFLLVKGAEQYNLMFFIAFAGAMAYSSSSNGPHDFYGFVASAAIALAILMTQIPRALGSSAMAVEGMCLLYFFSLSLSARNARKSLLSSIDLRLENQVLAEKNAANAIRAEIASKEKSAFLAAASHDLRQPLHALTLLLQAHQQQAPDAAKHPLLQNAKIATDSISELFNGLMEISSIEAGGNLPKLALFDVSHMLRQVFVQFQPAAREKGLNLRIFVSQSISRRTILSDKSLLERVVSNLLSNSLRYTEKGTILIALRRAHRANEGLWIEVWDTGIGIAEADQSRIFQPYAQLGNPERDRTKGLGLGLAIVKGTLSALEFDLSIRSTLGKGTVFRVYIPQRHCKINRVKPPISEALDGQGDRQVAQATNSTTEIMKSGSLHNLKILFIDDDAMVATAMAALVNSWGGEIYCVQTLEQAYGVASKTSTAWEPDCILSDFRLPGEINGVEVLRALKVRYPRARCILQTGEPAGAMTAPALQAGIPVLFKPVSPEILFEALKPDSSQP